MVRIDEGRARIGRARIEPGPEHVIHLTRLHRVRQTVAVDVDEHDLAARRHSLEARVPARPLLHARAGERGVGGDRRRLRSVVRHEHGAEHEVDLAVAVDVDRVKGRVARERGELGNGLTRDVEARRGLALSRLPEVNRPRGQIRVAGLRRIMIDTLDKVGLAVPVHVGEVRGAPGAAQVRQLRTGQANRKGPFDAGVLDRERAVRLGDQHVPVDVVSPHVVEEDIHPSVVVIVDGRAELRLDQRRIVGSGGVGDHRPVLGEAQRRRGEIRRRSARAAVASDEPIRDGVRRGAQRLVRIGHEPGPRARRRWYRGAWGSPAWRSAKGCPWGSA